MKILLQILLFWLVVQTSEAKDMLYNGIKPAIVIDVRTPAEFAAGHIDGAINISYEKIVQGIQSIQGLSKESPILLYCRSGHRSAIARNSLEQQGYTHILDGGGMETLSRNLKACANNNC